MWGWIPQCPPDSPCALQQPGALNSSIWDSSAVLRRIRGPLLTQVGCWG